MAETIRHQGRVESIADGIVKVRILQSSACSSCSAAKLCQSSETKEKVIDVQTTEADGYKVGDGVVLVGSLSQGLKATWWAYVLPLILIVVAAVAGYAVTQSDAAAGGLSLLVLVVYYGAMYALRSRFERRFAFSIEKKKITK